MEYSKERYNSLISSLFERHPSVQSVGFAAGAYKPGLEGMLRFDRALGEPWKQFSTIHIAGTNGKGSVSSMLAAALAASGLRVGLYTSPHLVDFRERMKVVSGGSWTMVSEEYVWDFLHRAPLDNLSFFEITTGMAFSWFASQGVDAAVIETGLGGRLDSTNIIMPELSIITGIGLDHCAMLGDSRAQIASEKAGIFKGGVPALVAGRDAETAPVFEARAAEVHCPLFFADDFGEPDFSLDLEGPCQRENLHTTLAALELLGIAPDTEALRHSGRITGFRGRWERVCGHPETICDIGHNPDALRINFKHLTDSGRPLYIVYGIMADKDLDAIRPLMPQQAEYYLVAPAISRSLPVEELYERTEGLSRRRCGSVAEGVRAALEDAAGVPDSLVYVGGSNFVVAECISYLEK